MAKVEPGRDPGMARRTEKLNVVFALSSIGLLVAFSLMVWADYNRGWKKYQLEFNRMEVKTTQDQIQQVLGKVGADRVKAIDDELRKGDGEIAARRADVTKAQAEIDHAHAAWYRVDQDYRFTK